MFERTFKTVDGKLRIAIPSQLNELTIGQMMTFQAGPLSNELEIISVLSEITLDHLYNIQRIDDLKVFNPIIEDLIEQIKHNYDYELIPDKITFRLQGPMETVKVRNFFSYVLETRPTFKEVTVPVIRNLSLEPAGAFMNVRDLIADEINDAIKKHGEEDWKHNYKPPLMAACRVLGHYFYAKVNGTYDEVEAEKFAEEVKKLPLTKALPIAAFFFLNYPHFEIKKIGFWPRVRQYSRKRRALRNSRNSRS